MSHSALFYIEKSFSARYASDFPRYGYSGPAEPIIGPAGTGGAAQIGITIDTDPALHVRITGIKIRRIDVLYDPAVFYVSPRDLTLYGDDFITFREGNMAGTTLFQADVPTDIREHFVTIYPYAPGSRAARVTTMPHEEINKGDWLTMRVFGGYRETAIFKKSPTNKNGDGDFTFVSVSRGPPL
ncbi:hypothetical protein [Nitrospirillum viridazoti]|uniref:hypothetical protein n=1 Tax=Nitrospirillum viridazoti TaxID=3144925 RepID=UPI00110FBDD3|nr:hypothetical protein [Nitrospirillum amazonense]